MHLKETLKSTIRILIEELDANRYNSTPETGIIIHLMMTQYKGRNM
jgi:hypothetical protein